MELSDHALQRMQRDGTTEGEVSQCLKEGKPVAKQSVRGEMRYSKEVELKFKKIIVVYCIAKPGAERVITVYPVRKKW